MNQAVGKGFMGIIKERQSKRSNHKRDKNNEKDRGKSKTKKLHSIN